MRKMHKIVCTVSNFRTMHSNRVLLCIVVEETGADLLFQRFAHVNFHTSFMVREDTHDRIYLKSILIDAGIDSVALPVCRTKLISIELVFNVIVQRLASRFNETTLNRNDDVLLLLNSVIESIIPDVMFSFHIKCR